MGQPKETNSTDEESLRYKLLNDFGDLLSSMGRFEEAKNRYEESLQIQKLLLEKDPENIQYQLHMSVTQYNLGTLLEHIGRFEEAKNRYEESLQIQKLLLENDPKNVQYKDDLASIQYNLGILLKNLGHLEEARRRFEESLQTQKILFENDPKNVQYQARVIAVQNELSILLSDMGMFGEAKSTYEELLEIQKLMLKNDPGNIRYQLVVATIKNDLGILLSKMGEFEEAKVRYEESLLMKKKLLEKDPNNVQYQSTVALTQNNLGTLLKDMGMFEEAKVRYEESLKTQKLLLGKYPENVQYQSDLAATQHNLATLLSNMGKFEEAKKKYEATLQMQKHLLEKDPKNIQYQSDVSATQNNFGNLLFDMDLFEDAKNTYEESLQIQKLLLEKDPKNVQYQSTVASAQYNLGTLFSFMGRFGEAKSRFEESLQLESFLLENNPKNIQYKLDMAKTQNSLGTLLQRQKFYSDALNYHLNALKLVSNSKNFDLLFRIFNSLGICYENTGDTKSAFESYGESILKVELIRSQFSQEENKIDIMWDKNSAYSSMISLLCTKMRDVGRAWEYVEKAKSRTLLDLLRFIDLEVPKEIPEKLQSNELELVRQIRRLDRQKRTVNKAEELESVYEQIIKVQSALNDIYAKIDYCAPEYVDLRKGKLLKIDEIIKLLETLTVKTAFIEYYIVKAKVFIFVISSEDKKPKVKVIDLPYEKLLDYVERYFTEIIEMPGIGDTWEELSEYLIEPVIDYVEGCDIVYIIPYGLLHYLPIHALPIRNKRLIEYFPIVYSPSLAAIKYSQGKVDLSLESCLSLGYTPNKYEKELFEREAVLVANIFSARRYIDNQATTSLLSQHTGYDVIHISCHGGFNPEDPLESGLLFADKILTVREIFGMDIKTNLLVLSACETGLSEHKPGDELIGLTRAFLYAGAESIVVSLWLINAKSTLKFMERFYQKIKNESITKAKALQEVQIEFIHDKDYSHPYFWAPFILIGDWK